MEEMVVEKYNGRHDQLSCLSRNNVVEVGNNDPLSRLFIELESAWGSHKMMFTSVQYLRYTPLQFFG